MDCDSRAAAHGYSYCTFACNSTVRGYRLSFSDQQSAFPTDPQGQRDSYNPTFYGRRIVSSDSGGRIFVQPGVEEAPFTTGYQGLDRRRRLLPVACEGVAGEGDLRHGQGPGKVTVTASVPARKLRARSSRARLASDAATKGITVVAGGSATATAPGNVTIALRPTRAARRAVARLRGATLTLTAAQGAATGTGKVKLR